MSLSAAEEEFLVRLIEEPEDQIRFDFHRLVKHPVATSEPCDWETASHLREKAGILPLSVSFIISDDHTRHALCPFCLEGKNLVTKGGILKEAFCSSCRSRLSAFFPCPRCRGARWVNELGQPAKLCKRCFAYRRRLPPIQQVKIPHDGDWVCPTCSNYNYAFRFRCNSCHQFRPSVTTAKIEELKEEKWICSRCGYDNYYRRWKCHKCSSLKRI